MRSQHPWWAIVTLGLATFMASIDINIVTLALPPMAKYFQTSAASMSLVVLSYAVALLLFLLPAGQWITRFRPLTIFLIAVIGFSASSILCGLSLSFVMLIIGRIIQGAFAAFITTMGTALAAVIVAPEERGKAMGILTGVSTLGSVLGSALGGFLVNYWGWSSIFFVNVPVCLCVIVLGSWTLQELSRETAFGRSQHNVLHTMFTLLQRTQFVAVLLCLCCLSLVVGAVYFLLPFDFSLVQHFNSSISGLILLCIPLAMATMALAGGYLTDRYGARTIMFAGILVVIAGIGAQALVLGAPASGIDIAWRLILTGGGIGLFGGAIQTLLVSLSSKQALGIASAFSVLVRYLGFAIGPFLVSITWLFVAKTSAQMVDGSLAIGGATFIGLLLAWLATRGKEKAIPSESLSSTLSSSES